jgi:hypothetical protein
VKTMMEVRRTGVRTSQPVRIAGPCFLLGGIAFFAGGLTHPSGSGHGNKVQQLHEMLGRSGWYPAHALLLAAVALVSAGIFASRQRQDLTSGMERLLRIAFVIGCITVVSMTVHLLAPLGAASVAGGKPALLSRVQALNELVDASWALSLAALAVAGGVTGTVGNRLTIPFGLVGGLAFALASATVPFTDTFDALFKVGSLLSVWAIAVGVIAVRNQS